MSAFIYAILGAGIIYFFIQSVRMYAHAKKFMNKGIALWKQAKDHIKKCEELQKELDDHHEEMLHVNAAFSLLCNEKLQAEPKKWKNLEAVTSYYIQRGRVALREINSAKKK